MMNGFKNEINETPQSEAAENRQINQQACGHYFFLQQTNAA